MTSSDHEFDLSNVNVREIDKDAEGITWTEEGTFIVQTPITGIDVEMKPITGKQETFLARSQESKRKRKLAETNLTDMMKLMVVSLNGNDSRSLIGDFVGAMPARDSRYLRKVYEENTPNIDMTQEFECPNCSYTTALEVPFTTDFFWPK